MSCFPYHLEERYDGVYRDSRNRMDRQELFLQPVNRMEIPEYYEVIKEPMCWLAIEEKLEKKLYVNVGEFKVGYCPI